MKIKALRTIVGEYGRIVRNSEAEVQDEIGKQLVAKGYAEEVSATPAPVESTPPAPAPQKKAKADAVDDNS